MGAYVGHFVDEPTHQFLALAGNFQEALDSADMLGQPDESSVRPVSERLFLRVSLHRIEDHAFIASADKDPIPFINADLLRLQREPGTGPTGDGLRSLGPRCAKCDYLHFDMQECKVFLEPDDPLNVTLLAHPRRPGKAIIEVHPDPVPAALELQPGFVEVCDLDELGAFAVFPFIWKKERYVNTPWPAADESPSMRLHDALLAADIVAPQIPPEY